MKITDVGRVAPVPIVLGASVVGLIALVGLLQPKPVKPEAAAPTQGFMQQKMQAMSDPSKGPQLVEVPANWVFGSSSPERILTVGYQWSPAVQGNPRPMATAIQEFSKFLETALSHINEKVQVRFANVDLYPEVPLGICVDNYPLSDFTPNEMSPTAAKHIVQGLMDHINQTLAPTPRERQLMKKSRQG